MNKRTMRNSLARAMADVHNHQLTNFSTSREDRTNAGAMCMKCGMLAVIHYDAETKIFDGPALRMDCPGGMDAVEVKKEPTIHEPFERLTSTNMFPQGSGTSGASVPFPSPTPFEPYPGSFYPAPVSPEFNVAEVKAHRIPQPEKLQENLKHLERDAKKFHAHMADPFKEDPIKILKKSGIVLKVMRKQLLEYAGVESREELEDLGLTFVDEEPEYWNWFWTAESQAFPLPEQETEDAGDE